MKINLPKTYIGMAFDKLFSIQIQECSLEMLFPALFFLLESKGKQPLKLLDSTKIDEYLSKLQLHSRLEGFDDTDGKRVLNKWVKTSLMVLGKKGQAKQKGDQIIYVQPLTYLTFKTGGLPSRNRLRNVHYFLYTLMVNALKDSGEPQAYKTIRNTFRIAFARGVTGLPEVAGTEIGGEYDGASEVDTETLLAMLFMDSFEPVKISAKREVSAAPPVCEGQANRFMRGLVKFITVFKDRMPARELVYNLQTLINFELCIYTLKLCYGTNQLVRTRELPPQYSLESLPTSPQLYTDITHQPKGMSLELARQCVGRDLQELSNFFTSMLRLRTLDKFVTGIPDLVRELKELLPQEYLLKLLMFADHSRIQGKADNAIDEISELNHLDKPDSEEHNLELKELMERHNDLYSDDSLTRLVMILDHAQRQGIGTYPISWFRVVSGVARDYGFIRGSTKNRYTWAYSFSNDLLWTLVHLAAIRPDEMGNNEDDRQPRPLRLVEFLEFLEKRYGILIHKVPDGMASIEANRAARDNLAALQKRLRQMGLFENLSDDFEAQYITPQYREVFRPNL